MDRYTLLYIKWITRTYSGIENSAQCDVAAWLEGSLENGYVYIWQVPLLSA